MLDIAPLFDKVTYISATPIERQYYLEELKHLPEYRIEWPNAVRPNIRSHNVDKPLEYIAGICKNRIKKSNGENYHIFLNSTSDIAIIIQAAGLTEENTRVICSQNEDSLKVNLYKLGGFPISKTHDGIKAINFYTSTCFEGQDIYDDNGRTFIVSNPSKEHTLMDISTTFIQVCGRIRNSNFNREIIHFYSTNRYINDVSIEDYEKSTRLFMADAQSEADSINNMQSERKLQKIANIRKAEDPYLRIDKNNTVIVDTNILNLEMMNYKIVNGIYQSQFNLINEMGRSGLNVTNDDSYTAPDSIKLVAGRRASFKDLFTLYCNLKDSLTIDYKVGLIENIDSLIPEAYTKLTRKKVAELNYKPHEIKREIIKQSHKPNEYKIVSLIEETLQFQKAIPIAEAKRALQRIYNELGISKTAKATDLNN